MWFPWRTGGCMSEGMQSYILFKLGETTFAVASAIVQELELVEDITPVPNAASYVEGIVLVRGRVVPVINLRARFGMPRIPWDQQARIIVLDIKGRKVGLLVDAAREFLEISGKDVQPPPDTVSGVSTQLLEGVVVLEDDRLVLILDIEELLSASEAEVLPRHKEVEQ
ncbi:MAG TPA: purine-binding chemotaxis protein CheW [Chloroflexi bacterium]|nr:purine-binding chemotaxis protein CheW [Chloroflexota bacterium]